MSIDLLPALPEGEGTILRTLMIMGKATFWDLKKFNRILKTSQQN